MVVYDIIEVMKRCSKCKKLKDIQEFDKDKRTKDGYRCWCRKCSNAYAKNWFKKAYLKNPKKYKKKSKSWGLKNPKRKKEIDKRHKLKLRIEVLEHYGGKNPRCACCGEGEIKFLSIDHIRGNGNKHRGKVGRGNAFYYWLKRNNYPKGYQILCHNCNLAKGFYGKCPHQEK